jgi:type II secretory pathway component PulJ
MFARGRRGGNAGFILLDAILCLFIASVLLVSVYGGIRCVARLSTSLGAQAERIIAERNALVSEE